MQIGYTKEQEELRTTLREYYEKLLTPEIEAELAVSNGIGPTVRSVVKQMATDGWLGIGWPKEYGGQGRSAIEQLIFFDESMRRNHDQNSILARNAFWIFELSDFCANI